MDVVWDRYVPAVLKIVQEAKEERVSRRVRPDPRIPGDWTAFLRVDENWQKLFLYLNKQLTTIETDHGEVVCTKHDTVVFNNDRTDAISPYMHEKADARLLLHAVDAARRGFTEEMLRPVDTYLLLIKFEVPGTLSYESRFFPFDL